MEASSESRSRVPDWLRLALALAAWRAAMSGVVLLSVQLLPVFFDRWAFEQNFHWPADAVPTLFRMFRTWDGEHYLYLAQEGYTPGSPSNRFYPLWPLLVRAGSVAFGGSVLASSLVLSSALAVAATVLLHRMIAARSGVRVADTAAALLVAFPGALFFGLPYSESLFLFLAVLLFWALERDRLTPGDSRAFGVAMLAGVLLPVSRPVGLLALAPIVVHLFLGRARGRRLLLALAPVLGFGLYLGVMQVIAGDAFAGFSSQLDVVSAPSVKRLFDVAGFVKLWTRPLAAHGFFDSALDRLWFLWLLATLVPMARRDWRWVAFALPMGLVPAMTTSLMSFTRYAAVIFPMFVVTAELLAKEERRHWRALVLASLVVLQLLLLLRHVNFIWVA